MKCQHLVSIQVRLLCLLFILPFQAAAQQAGVPNGHQPNVILGVLEDQPGIYSGDPYFRIVRAVFQKSGSEWRSFPTDCSNTQCLKLLPKSYPLEVNWTIAFDGKDLGRVVAQTPADFRFYSLVGMEEIKSSGPVPTVGKKSEKYSGWLFQPVYRPLVAVSQPNFKDPDRWKPAQLSTHQVEAVRKEFRNKFPKASNCKNPVENKLVPWKYRDEDIKISSSYSSNNGWSLVEIGLTGYACDGPTDDDGPFIGQWYVIEPSGKMRFLGYGMWLIDAGDYDGDSKSEVLFAVEGYNKGGYRIFYQDFSKSVEFLYSYH